MLRSIEAIVLYSQKYSYISKNSNRSNVES